MQEGTRGYHGIEGAAEVVRAHLPVRLDTGGSEESSLGGETAADTRDSNRAAASLNRRHKSASIALKLGNKGIPPPQMLVSVHSTCAL